MDNCCVETVKKMHDITNYFWWFQRFVLASPFVLLIPEFDPTVGTRDLAQTGLQKSVELAYSMASNVVYKNKTLPDFIDAVRAIGKMNYDRLRLEAEAHATRHSFGMKEKHIANFWHNMGQAYNEAFFSA